MTRSSTSTSHNENKTFNNGFSKMMQDKFSERNAPIRHCIPSVKKQQNFIQTCNWKFVNSFNMHEASQLFLNKHERSISTSLEPFDEFSSLALLHKQYSVTLGGLGRYLHQSTLQDLLKFHTVNFQKLHHSRGNDEGRILHSLLQRIRLAESSIQVLGQKIKNFVVVNRDIPVRSTIKICTKCGVNIVLREATNDDSQDIISIFQQCFKSVSEKFVAVRKFVKKSVKNLKDLEIEYCKKRGSNFWVAEVLDDGSTSSKIVGCIGLKSVKIFDPRDNLSSHRESQGEVSHMCVDSQHQKQGIAQALLEYLITYVQDSIRGISHIPNKFPTTKDSVMFNENNHKMKDRSLDLTLLSGLDSAKALYVKMGFLDKGVLVDLGGNCFLQHMSLDV
jgi:ribosomal protein S18 acetylase RimI-like enzyme